MSAASGNSTGAPANATDQRSTTTTDDPSASGATTGQGASGTTQPDSAIANPEAKKYADEAAQYRKLLRDAEAKVKAFQDAQLTADQKRERDLTELQTKATDYELQLQRLHLENAGLRLAPSLGIADPAAALALVQVEHAAEIKYGDDGRPENLDALLKAVLKNHPALAGTTVQPKPPTAGGATNPGRAAGNGGLTLEQILAMPMREKMARIDEIKAWEQAQKQRQ